MIHALIFVPGPDHAYWVTACWQYCMRHGYTPQAVVHSWADVVRLMLIDPRVVVVMARRGHLPPDRFPRVEVITDEASRAEDAAHRRPSQKWEDHRRPPGPAPR